MLERERERERRKMPGPPIALVWATNAGRQFTGHQYQIPFVWATRVRYSCRVPPPCMAWRGDAGRVVSGDLAAEG